MKSQNAKALALIVATLSAVSPLVATDEQSPDTPRSDTPQSAPPETFAGLPLLDSDEFTRYSELGGQELWAAGKISEVFRHPSGMIFINFTELRSGLTAVAYPEHADAWASIDLTARFVGKFVMVRGQLTFYKGRAQIAVVRPEELIIVEGGWGGISSINIPLVNSTSAPPEQP